MRGYGNSRSESVRVTIAFAFSVEVINKRFSSRALWTSEPFVLLLDEPTAGIDIATKEYLYGMIRKLAESGLSIVMASSDLDELPLVCDRIAIFKRGRVTTELPGTTSRASIVHHLFAREAASTNGGTNGPTTANSEPI